MNTSDNFPTQDNAGNQPNAGKGKNLAIGILCVALVGLGIYTIADKNQSGNTIQQQQTQIATISDEKSDIQKSFDASLVRLDSMTTVKKGLESQLSENNKEISKDKVEIRSILNKKNATAAELNKAKDLIANLNSKISDMEQQVAQLTQQNQALVQDTMALTQDKQQLTTNLAATTATNQVLEQKVDVASTLNASNIVITPVKVKGNGEEKVTVRAKRADKLMISFNVTNRIVTPGSTDVYVSIIGPDGKPVMAKTTESGTLTTRDQGDVPYTAKVPVVLDSTRTKSVQFGFSPAQRFEEGNYTISIYQNGFKIGEATQELKKGGIFG